MPIVIEVVDESVRSESFEKVFSYLFSVDERFSTYKNTSEVMRLNREEISESDTSAELREVLKLSEETRQASNGYFNIRRSDGSLDPSGLVKGWAIRNAAGILEQEGYKNFYVEAGGDVEVRGHNNYGKKWSIGIKNPFNKAEVVKVLCLNKGGVATSGTYERGQHIYNPHAKGPLLEIMSFSVVGPDVYEADRFVTAAFAMGKAGIYFIEGLDGLEGYMIDKEGRGTETTGFHKYTRE